jgi:hypothetical protein
MQDRRSARFGLRLLLALAVAGTLSACADPAPAYYQAFGFRCEDKKGAVAAVMCNKSNDPGAAKVSRYCYKSLADTTCFDRPDPDRKNMPQGSPG